MGNIAATVEAQRAFFATDATKNVEFRLSALKRLKETLCKNEAEILDALQSDLNKAPFEGYMTELGMVLDELGFAIRHVRKWAASKRVKTPISQFAASSFVISEPYGVALIMAPWNYPLQLCIEPLIGAIAAGNCAVVKPSAYAPATSGVIARLIGGAFPLEYIAVVEGGREQNTELLDQRFDYIFFTGGTTVGKLVLEKAARYLTPVSLEMGGKSPCIVDETADIPLAAKRIAFGKFLNAGQTCVAPDYVYVQQSVKERLLIELEKAVRSFFPNGFDELPVIINQRHFNRLTGLMQGEDKRFGGEVAPERRFIAPTVLTGITWNSPVMQEEIFGPILPVLAFDDINEAVSEIKKREKPLALYLFTTNASNRRRVLSSLSYGGGCVNDTIVHLATPYMGFGGVGQSGMGSYHGKLSFDAFSHKKSIMDKKNFIDLGLRYHPYTEAKWNLLHKFLK